MCTLFITVCRLDFPGCADEQPHRRLKRLERCNRPVPCAYARRVERAQGCRSCDCIRKLARAYGIWTPPPDSGRWKDALRDHWRAMQAAVIRAELGLFKDEPQAAAAAPSQKVPPAPSAPKAAAAVQQAPKPSFRDLFLRDDVPRQNTVPRSPPSSMTALGPSLEHPIATQACTTAASSTLPLDALPSASAAPSTPMPVLGYAPEPQGFPPSAAVPPFHYEQLDLRTVEEILAEHSMIPGPSLSGV